MPATRCRYFFNNGARRGDGCTASKCRYVHPEDWSLWSSLSPIKSNVRCKYFNSNGTTKGHGCPNGNGDCRFIHPEDPKWQDVDASRAERPIVLPPYIPMSSVPSAPRTLRDVSDRSHRPVRSNTNGSARPSLSRIQTDTAEVEVKVATHPSMGSEFTPVAGDPKDLPAPVGSTNPGVTSLRSSPMGPTPSRVPQDPLISDVPGSAATLSIDGDKRLVWKKRLSLLAQALALEVEIHHKIAISDRRRGLHSDDIVYGMASAARNNIEDFLNSSKENSKILEETLESVIAQLVESDLWSQPSPDDAVGTGERFDGWEALVKRFDEVESQLKEGTSLGALAHHDGTAIATSIIHDGNPSLRPLKRRRISLNGPVMRSSILTDAMGRLDSIERKAIELEAETLHDERLAELIDELLEVKVRASTLFMPHTGSGHLDFYGVGTDIDPSPFLEPLESVVQHLNGTFDICCVELAESVAASGELEAGLGQIRTETGTLKEGVAQLETGQRSLREKQDDVDRRIRDIEEEMVKLRFVSPFENAFANTRDRFAHEVEKGVRDSVDVSVDQLKHNIDNQQTEMLRGVLTSVEPTLFVTESIYEFMGRHFEKERRSLDLGRET